MKILYSASYPIPSRAANGVHVTKMSQALALDGHDVTLITPEYNREVNDKTHEDIFSWYGVKPVFKHKKTLGFIKGRIGLAVHSLSCIYKYFISQSDLIYARCLGTAFMASLFRIPFVFEQHLVYSKSDGIVNYIYNNIVVARSMIALVVISESLKNILLNNGSIEAHKIIVAHDGADAPQVSNERSTIIKDSSKINVGYVGHLYEGRGIDIIFELSKRMLHVDFYLIGGNPEAIKLWQDRSAGHNNFILCGHLPPHIAQSTMREFNILLAPYQTSVSVMGKTDTAQWMSPLKIFEYMAAEKPIICSNLNVLKEVLKNNYNSYLCSPSDAEEWEMTINKIINNSVDARVVASNAYKDFVELYTWDVRAKNIMNFVKGKIPLRHIASCAMRMAYRTARVATIYPKSFMAKIMLLMDRIPFVTTSSQRFGDIELDKSAAVRLGQSKGWAIHDKILSFLLFKYKVCSLRLKEGVELTAQHFYFSRPTKDFSESLRLLKSKNVFINFSYGMSVFEPGCGAARYLAHMEDRYNAQATGRDIYASAIHVAQKVDIYKTMDLAIENVMSPSFLEKYSTSHFDLVYTNSHLCHVLHHDNFEDYFSQLIRVGKQLFIIERPEPQLIEVLKKRNIVHIVQNNKLIAGDVKEIHAL